MCAGRVCPARFLLEKTTMNRRSSLVFAAMSAATIVATTLLLLPSIVQANPIVTGWESELYTRIKRKEQQKSHPQFIKNYNWREDSQITPRQKEIMNEAYELRLKANKRVKQKAKQVSTEVNTKIYSEKDQGSVPLNTILIDPIAPIQQNSLRPESVLQNSNANNIAKPMKKPMKRTMNISKKANKGAI